MPMLNNIPLFPFRNNSESKSCSKHIYTEIKPRKEIIQQIIAYSKALDVLKGKNITAFCVMN
jgi:hypothetical protein